MKTKQTTKRTTRQRFRAILATASLVVAGALGTAVSASADTGGYPYANGPTCANNQCTPDAWRFYQRECTSFVAWKLNGTNGFNFKNDFDGNGSLDFGNASQWGPVAHNFGYQVNMTPAVGAVAWWSSMHVAWVEAVNGDQVTIQEYNYNYNHNYNRRVINRSSVSGYIHFKDLAGSVPSSTLGSSSVAFQANTGNLYNYSPAGASNTQQGMKSGTSPAITALSGGGYESAFQANTGNLYVWGDAGNGNTQQGMMAGTSSAIAR